jgi:hypothetical protein
MKVLKGPNIRTMLVCSEVDTKTNISSNIVMKNDGSM